MVQSELCLQLSKLKSQILTTKLYPYSLISELHHMEVVQHDDETLTSKFINTFGLFGHLALLRRIHLHLKLFCIHIIIMNAVQKRTTVDIAQYSLNKRTKCANASQCYIPFHSIPISLYVYLCVKHIRIFSTIFSHHREPD